MHLPFVFEGRESHPHEHQVWRFLFDRIEIDLIMREELSRLCYVVCHNEREPDNAHVPISGLRRNEASLSQGQRIFALEIDRKIQGDVDDAGELAVLLGRFGVRPPIGGAGNLT